MKGELRWTSPHQFSASIIAYFTWVKPLKNFRSSSFKTDFAPLSSVRARVSPIWAT